VSVRKRSSVPAAIVVELAGGAIRSPSTVYVPTGSVPVIGPIRNEPATALPPPTALDDVKSRQSTVGPLLPSVWSSMFSMICSGSAVPHQLPVASRTVVVALENAPAVRSTVVFAWMSLPLITGNGLLGDGVLPVTWIPVPFCVTALPVTVGEELCWMSRPVVFARIVEPVSVGFEPVMTIPVWQSRTVAPFTLETPAFWKKMPRCARPPAAIVPSISRFERTVRRPPVCA
jgi:hypothetical protein